MNTVGYMEDKHFFLKKGNSTLKKQICRKKAVSCPLIWDN